MTPNLWRALLFFFLLMVLAYLLLRGCASASADQPIPDPPPATHAATPYAPTPDPTATPPLLPWVHYLAPVLSAEYGTPVAQP